MSSHHASGTSIPAGRGRWPAIPRCIATFFTAHLPGELVGWRDVTIARTIASRFGLTYRVMPHRRADNASLREWVVQTGGETGELRGWHDIKTFRQVDTDKMMLNGWVGDVARPIF